MEVISRLGCKMKIKLCIISKCVKRFFFIISKFNPYVQLEIVSNLYRYIFFLYLPRWQLQFKFAFVIYYYKIDEELL